MSKTQATKQPSEIEKAKALLEQEKQKRSKKAWDEVQKVLQDNRCMLNFAFEIQGQRVPLDQILQNKLIVLVQPID